MNRNPYEQDERMLRGSGREFEGYRNPYFQSQQFSPHARFQAQEPSYLGGYGTGGPLGQPIDEFENRYVGYGQPGRFAGYGIEQERAARQWQTPQFPGPQTWVSGHGWPALQGWQGDPLAQGYYAQGIAPRGYIGQSRALGSAFLGQSPAYRTLGPNLYDPMNLQASFGMGDITPLELGLHQQLLPVQQQQLLQQQLLQQQLQQQQQQLQLLQQLQQQPFQRQQFVPQSFRGLGPKGFVRSDERLKEEVCERLIAHPEIDASEITVEARQGVVILTGTVTDRMIKHQIEDVVDNVIGVKDIENNITVRPRAPLEAGGVVGRGPVQGQAGKPRH